MDDYEKALNIKEKLKALYPAVGIPELSSRFAISESAIRQVLGLVTPPMPVPPRLARR